MVPRHNKQVGHPMQSLFATALYTVKCLITIYSFYDAPDNTLSVRGRAPELLRLRTRVLFGHHPCDPKLRHPVLCSFLQSL